MPDETRHPGESLCEHEQTCASMEEGCIARHLDESGNATDFSKAFCSAFKEQCEHVKEHENGDWQTLLGNDIKFSGGQEWKVDQCKTWCGEQTFPDTTGPWGITPLSSCNSYCTDIVAKSNQDKDEGYNYHEVAKEYCELKHPSYAS